MNEKYIWISSVPANIYNIVAADMKGPKGISSFLLLIFRINNIVEKTAPIIKEKNIMKKTPFKP